MTIGDQIGGAAASLVRQGQRNGRKRNWVEHTAMGIHMHTNEGSPVRHSWLCGDCWLDRRRVNVGRMASARCRGWFPDSRSRTHDVVRKGHFLSALSSET